MGQKIRVEMPADLKLDDQQIEELKERFGNVVAETVRGIQARSASTLSRVLDQAEDLGALRKG